MSKNDTQSNRNSSVDVRVGIVIPCKDRASTIIAAVKSVLAQTHKTIAICVIDDGSTDDSASLVRQMMTSMISERLEDKEVFTLGKVDETPLILISHEVSEGAPTTKNKGLLALWQTAKYFTVLHADDTMYPDKIAQCLAILEADNRVGVVYHDALVTDQVNQLTYREFLPAFDRARLEYNPRIPSDFLFPKAAVETAGIYETKISNHESWELCLRLTERHAGVHIPVVLSTRNTDKQSRAANEKDIINIRDRTEARKQNV